jgi:hypothetical protein
VAYLLRGDVHAGYLEARGEALRIGNTRPAAELEDARPVLQPRHKLFLPLSTRIADDPVAPLAKCSPITS